MRMIYQSVPDQVVREIPGCDTMEAFHPAMQPTAVAAHGPNMHESSRHALEPADRAPRIHVVTACPLSPNGEWPESTLLRQGCEWSLDAALEEVLDFP